MPGHRAAFLSHASLGAALSAASALVLAVAIAGCGEPAGKSLVIITLDTTRADHLSCYGYPLPTSPNIDALAARGVLFEQAYAPMPQTLPSHATLFTGLPPRAHKAVENSHVLGAEFETLAEILEQHDYETSAFIGARVMDDSTGIQQGFQVFDLPTGQQKDLQHEVERRAAAVTDSALSWALARHFAAKPFLLWAHYYDPHGPYEPREERIPLESVAAQVRRYAEFADLSAEDRAATEAIWYGYDNELAYMDAQVGRLIAGLRQREMLDDTIVVVVGDHGEGLMEHGEKSHGATIFQELMLVPLIIVLPDGSRAGTRVKAPVQMQDLLPTLLDLAGIAGEAGALPGLDLAPGLRQGSEPDAQAVFVERPYYTPEGIRGGRALAHGWGFGELAGAIVGDDKLVRLPRDAETGQVEHQLFDLAADPDELRNIAAERPGCVAKLSAQLDDWLRRFPVGDEVVAPPLSPERLEGLRALGYIAGEEEPPEAPGSPLGAGASPWGPLDPAEAPQGPDDCGH